MQNASCNDVIITSFPGLATRNDLQAAVRRSMRGLSKYAKTMFSSSTCWAELPTAVCRLVLQTRCPDECLVTPQDFRTHTFGTSTLQGCCTGKIFVKHFIQKALCKCYVLFPCLAGRGIRKKPELTCGGRRRNDFLLNCFEISLFSFLH